MSLNKDRLKTLFFIRFELKKLSAKLKLIIHDKHNWHGIIRDKLIDTLIFCKIKILFSKNTSD